MAGNLIYQVLILRVDGNHMVAFKSENQEEANTAYKGLELEWKNSTAEKRPFQVLNQMHSMLPSLISELKVETLSADEYQKQSNPYYDQMNKNGLSGAMNQNFNKGQF